MLVTAGKCGTVMSSVAFVCLSARVLTFESFDSETIFVCTYVVRIFIYLFIYLFKILG